jgi:transcriptional regulator with XRE-family HTH domain
MHRRLNGAAVKALRQAIGISLRKLASEIDRNPGFLSRLERDMETASPTTMRAIATRLGVPLDAITYVVAEDEDEVPAA